MRYSQAFLLACLGTAAIAATGVSASALPTDALAFRHTEDIAVRNAEMATQQNAVRTNEAAGSYSLDRRGGKKPGKGKNGKAKGKGKGKGKKRFRTGKKKQGKGKKSSGKGRKKEKRMLAVPSHLSSEVQRDLDLEFDALLARSTLESASPEASQHGEVYDHHHHHYGHNIDLPRDYYDEGELASRFVGDMMAELDQRGLWRIGSFDELD